MVDQIKDVDAFIHDLRALRRQELERQIGADDYTRHWHGGKAEGFLEVLRMIHPSWEQEEARLMGEEPEAKIPEGLTRKAQIRDIKERRRLNVRARIRSWGRGTSIPRSF